MLVMTFNLRFANPTDGANEWQFRQDLVVDLIRRHAPDLLATQEGTVPMLRFLEAQLTAYLPLTAHRQVDETCQYPTIFYRAEGLAVKESGEFWLSQTPEVHRSLSWGSAYPRLATFGLFQAAGRTAALLLHQYPSGQHLGGGPPRRGQDDPGLFCPAGPAPDPGGGFQRSRRISRFSRN